MQQLGYSETAELYRYEWDYPVCGVELTARKGDTLYEVIVVLRHAQFGAESHFQIERIVVEGVIAYKRP